MSTVDCRADATASRYALLARCGRTGARLAGVDPDRVCRSVHRPTGTRCALLWDHRNGSHHAPGLAWPNRARWVRCAGYALRVWLLVHGGVR